MNPKQLNNIQPVTILSTSQLQLLFLNGQRSYTFAHDGENRFGVTDTSKVYIFTALSGHPEGIDTNDTESNSTLDGDFTSGINVSKAKLLSSRSLGVGPGISTVAYIASGNGSPTILVVPDKNEYGSF